MTGWKCARYDGAYWSSTIYATKESCEQYGPGYVTSCPYVSGWTLDGVPGNNVYPSREWRRYYAWNNGTSGTCGDSTWPHSGTYTIAKEQGVTYATCPANSTKNGTTGDCTCNSPYTYDGAGACTLSEWPASSGACSSYNGQEFTTLQVHGWDTTPNPAPGSALPVERKPVDINDHGCKATWQSSYLDGSGFGMCTTDSTPGPTGMYATRCYEKYKYTGAAGTTETTTEGGYNPAPPACTGSLGIVNGVTVCLPVSGTTQGASDVAPKVNADGSVSPRLTVEEMHTSGAADGGRNVSTYPPSPGTGATKVLADTSGQARGTSTASSSTSGSVGVVVVSGTTGGDVTVETCGLPGKPACKIDETGTPTDGALTTQKDEFNAAADALTQQITDLGGAAKKTDLGLTFSIQWPTGDCINPVFGVPRIGQLGSVPVCERISDIRAALGWFFGLLGGLYLWRRATAAT